MRFAGPMLIAAAVTFTAAFALGVRSQVGYNGRAERALYALLKGEWRVPRWLEWVPTWAWVPLLAPAFVGVLLLISLPFFAGGAFAYGLGYRDDGG